MSLRRLAILPLQLHVFNCVKLQDMIAFLCTSVLLLESFREPGTSASLPVNGKFIEDSIDFVEAASNASLLAHRLVTRFQPSARRQGAFQQLGHVQKDVIVVELLLSISLRASLSDTNRLVAPSWALFFVKAPFRSLRASSNMGCSNRLCSHWRQLGSPCCVPLLAIASFTRCPWKSAA